MIIDFEKLQEMLEGAKVHCLRCGTCCHNYDVMAVPGYGPDGRPGHKPGWHMCKHCQPRYLDNQGQWHLATCKIHQRPDYPKECKDFKVPVMGFSGPCALGLAVWKALQEEYPDSKLPEEVEKVLEQFESFQKLKEEGGKE